MYALVVCLDNIKRVVPDDYIQRREEDGSIAVFITDKQRFCNAVILEKNDDMEILLDRLDRTNNDLDGSNRTGTKRNMEESLRPTSFPAALVPALKRPRLASLQSECSQHHSRNHLPGSPVQHQGCDDDRDCDRESIDQFIKEEPVCSDSSPHGDYSGDVPNADVNSAPHNQNNDTGHHPLLVTRANDNSMELGNDFSLTRLLCEVLKDQRALDKRVQKVEGTLERILETVSKSYQMISGHSQRQRRVRAREAGQSQNEESDSDFGQSDDGGLERTPLDNQLIKSEPFHVRSSETSERDCQSSDCSLTAAHRNPTKSELVGNGTGPPGQRQKEQPQVLMQRLLRPATNIDGVTSVDQAAVPVNLNKSQPAMLQNDFVIIPIMHHGTALDDSIEEVMPPILIPQAEYRSLLLKHKTPTAFCRSLLRYFFSEGTLKSHNFSGGPVRTKQGRVIRGQLNPRMVVSLIDQVEREFPGSTKGRENMKLFKKAINDKCNHM